MNTQELQDLLSYQPSLPLQILLPGGGLVPVSFHITEVARVQKSFIDCGGARHETRTCQLQAWVGGDDDHRIAAGKLAAILDKAASAFGDEDLPVEIEYEDGLISQYPLSGVERTRDALVFHLVKKHTDCLAKELCGVPATSSGAVSEPEAAGSCCGGNGGCGL